MQIPTQQEYEQNEFRRAMRDEQEVERAPLSERKEAQAEVLDSMRNRPEVVAERVSWLLDGNYGKGAHMMAMQVLSHPRMNRRSALLQITSVFEYRCPRRMLIDAWKKLTAQQKKLLDAALDIVIEAAEREE